MNEEIKEHKKFINELVTKSPSVSARLIKEKGIATVQVSKKNINNLISKLDNEEKNNLSILLQDAKIDGISTVLDLLTQKALLENWTLVKNGKEIPIEPFGYSLIEEYLSVLEDGNWNSIESDAD